MIIQTIQPLSVWQEIEEKGIAYSKPDYSEYGGLEHSWNFKTSYDYMKKKMLEKGIIPEHSETDIFWGWAWSGDRDKKKVDLRTRIHHIKSPHVLLTLDIPSNQLLLSNFHLWHYVLNYWRVMYSLEEEKKWDKLCKKKSHNYYRQKPLSDISLHQDIENSWDCIFNLRTEDDKYYIDEKKEVIDYWQMPEAQIVQATFWNIKEKDIIKCQKIKAPILGAFY